jgi:hypothetical protein
MLAKTSQYDLKSAVADNRLVGLWRMLTGFRLTYLGAILTLGAATVARTATFLLLRAIWWIPSWGSTGWPGSCR